MKAEINETTKAQFIAQYFGQPVFFVGAMCYNLHPDDIGVLGTLPITLRTVDMLTDEDLLKLAEHRGTNIKDKRISIEVVHSHDNEFHVGYYIVVDNIRKEFINQANYNLEQTDYLRSIGIALPWRGISVQEQIDNGWITIKNTDLLNK